MKEYSGILDPGIMSLFPSGTQTESFADWVANFAGLEQCLALGGMFWPSFFEINGLIFWDGDVARKIERDGPASRFGDDPVAVEKYWNIFNLIEFHLMAADGAQSEPQLVEAFGRLLQHFWSRALAERFPGRRFEFEIGENMFDEDGLCLTFWQVRP
jgi:hypothetical protein